MHTHFLVANVNAALAPPQTAFLLRQKTRKAILRTKWHVSIVACQIALQEGPTSFGSHTSGGERVLSTRALMRT